MKKQKKAAEWEEQAPDTSKDLEMDFEDFDEDIIELEDVVEPETIENDEDLFDTEILDADSELALVDSLESSEESDEDLFLDEDLLKEFPFLEEKKPAPGKTKPPKESEDLDKQSVTLEGLAAGAIAMGAVKEKLQSPGTDSKVLPVGVQESELTTKSSEETSRLVDELISSLEGKLSDLIEKIVEARLPDIVRSILREEIALIEEKERKNLENEK